MRQAFAPLRLSRWQLVKMFAAQINRDHPVTAKLVAILVLVAGYWIVSAMTRPKGLAKRLGLPVIKGSRTLEKDFAAVIERGRQMVGTSRPSARTNANQTYLYRISTPTSLSSSTRQAESSSYIPLRTLTRSNVLARMKPMLKISSSPQLLVTIRKSALKRRHCGRQ